MKCEDFVVSRVLVDNNSSANICPLSTLQKLKINTERIHMNIEIVVHGDEDIFASNDTSIPFIEAEDDKGPWVYQTFETVYIEKIPEGEFIPGAAPYLLVYETEAVIHAEVKIPSLQIIMEAEIDDDEWVKTR
uniref:Uncharacterized protein LOC104221793 n=1 Tax=Nicotiana sylvestris TaxID=4096 RepID=A0A1U7W203_NICSY|nr:PREDICTED: uncharacterized protein LOC104221793 [Nicotiana sylvestris]